MKDHIKDILQHYDVIQVPRDFYEGVMLPQNGKFFVMTPENPELYWQDKLEKHSFLQNVIYKTPTEGGEQKKL